MWLFDAVSAIPTLNKDSIQTYWSTLRKGLSDDKTVLLPSAVKDAITSDTQPIRVQRMLNSLLKNNPDLETEELRELITIPVVDKKPVSHSKPLPSIEDFEEWRNDALDIILTPPPPQKKLQAGARQLRSKALTVWTVLELALSGLPLRNSALASIYINDDDKPNNLDTEREVLIIREHKNTKTAGDRFFEMDGFAKEWEKHAMSVFGFIPKTLVSNKTGNPLSPNAFSHALRDINPALGSQSTRRVVITDSILHDTYEEDAELAHRVGHGMGVHRTTYFAGEYAPKA